MLSVVNCSWSFLWLCFSLLRASSKLLPTQLTLSLSEWEWIMDTSGSQGQEVTVPFFQSGATVLEKCKGRFSSLSQLSRFNSSLSAVTYQLECVPHICCWTNAVLGSDCVLEQVSVTGQIVRWDDFPHPASLIVRWTVSDSVKTPSGSRWISSDIKTCFSPAVIICSWRGKDTVIKPLIWKDTITPQLVHCYLLSIVSSSLTGYLPEKNAVTVWT